ncbi:MAG: hypothetical protein ABJB02_04835 [Dokdonella sp.]
MAIAHFKKLLQAKQERVRQGPNYPTANPYSGRHDVLAATDHRDNGDTHAAPSAGTPEPEAVYGANAAHGRGNQGMRGSK